MSAEGSARGPLLPRHPLSLGDVIGGAVALYRETAGAAARVVAVVYAPLAVLNALAVAGTGGIDPQRPFEGLTSGDVTLLALATAVGFVVGPVVGAVLTWLAVERAGGGAPSWSEAYSATAGLVGRILLATLMVVVVAFLVIVAVLVPAGVGAMASPGVAMLILVVLGVPALLAVLGLGYLIVPAIVIEDLGPTAAVRRAWELLRVRLWPTLGTIVVAALLVGAVSLTIGIVTAPVSAAAGPAAFLVDAVGSTVSAMVTVPLLTYVALLIYIDAAVRLEGPDALPLPPRASSPA